ncbi:MAG: tRNA preQ1(34) S-adenosylmethionine ribosyltransferase-isomerase QueA [Candidatus Omnitrophica bacterium]|nr:tRNA preQ1(34) S-adenosylmethionine ribosyltransferase-isomerase QueA [Candidatus Omnitrophota bacterium]
MKKNLFKLSEYDFNLPHELIAQSPLTPRDSSRLLVINRKNSTINERVFRDIVDYLGAGDALVLNDTKVINARLLGQRKTGGKIEALLLRQERAGVWRALVNPGKRAKTGEVIFFEGGLRAKILGVTSDGGRILEFSSKNIKKLLPSLGKVPLPPYIKKEITSPEQYQTTYANCQGAIAAPTAGLHFTKALLKRIKSKGVKIVYITLHCGLSTFRPVKTDDIRDHPMSEEWIEISKKASEDINAAKRIVAVGTTVVRALESAAYRDDSNEWRMKSFLGDTKLYMTSDYTFKVVDALITNFHTPHSTNLILVSTLCGRELLKRSYEYAIKEKFRFFSFGDATFIE